MIAAEERERIERLARTLRWGPAGVGTVAGREAGGHLGRAGEFEEYRPWRPGDPLGSLDVRVYRRLRRRVARVDREDSALPFTLLVDRSASMAGDERDRFVRALSMFFVALARAHGEPRRVFVFAGHDGRPLAVPDVGRLEEALDAEPPAGDTDFARSFAAVPPDPSGPGRAVVISDAFGLADDRALFPLARLGRVTWIAPWLPEERHPTIRGPVRLRSRESEPAWHGVVDATTIARYRTRLAARTAHLESWCRARGGDALVGRVEHGWLATITAALERGRMLRR